VASCDRKKDGDWGSWALIVFLFAVGLWPVALVLLFLKLFAPDHRWRMNGIPPLQAQAADQAESQAENHTESRAERREYRAERREYRAENRENRARNAAKKVVKSPVAKRSNATVLKILGVVFAAAGVLAAMEPASSVLTGLTSSYLPELLQDLAISVAGIGMLVSGLSMDRAMRRYAQYLAMIGDAESMAFSQLAGKMGLPEKKVVKDLQKMIEKGYFGGKAYLNMELGYLFRSNEADAEMERRRREAEQCAQTPKETEEGYSGILRSIRRANDQIADPVLSEKISRLEDITAKIFRAVEEDPKKQKKIDKLLNYYLPTTQKLLDAYAEFERTGIEGENLRQAKERIQNTMDAIIAGFEHQLDELYQADVMDVDSDIRVMETMINRDTASVQKDFGLGGTPSPSAESGKTPKTGSMSAGPKDVDLGGTAAQQLEL